MRLQRHQEGTIVKAIQEHGLTSVDDIKRCTKAASSCGSCAGLCEQILIATVGGAADLTPKTEKPICGCTDHNHASVRKAIRDAHLTSIPEVMKPWNGAPQRLRHLPPGAELLPDLHLAERSQDDPQSRFINERAHANIQKRRHLFGGAADEGRRHQCRRAAPHCRCGRQIRHPDGENDRRPAH